MKKLLSTLLFTLSLMGSQARADTPSFHGMFLFGKNKTYASHLPMYHAPHDYQVLLELELQKLEGSNAIEKYEALKSEGISFFTILPEKMDLTQIMNGTKKSFLASIFKGHFERGAENMGKVKVNVSKILLSAPLDGGIINDNIQEYFVFGENGEYFAAHLIEGKPNFDAILKVASPYTLHFPPCNHRACPTPGPQKEIIPDEQIPMLLKVTDFNNIQPYKLPSEGNILGDYSFGATQVLEILYLEEGELEH